MQSNPFSSSKKNYCTFYIVRHGETEFNVNNIIQGQTDSPLTEKGLSQIREIAKELGKVKFAAVFSSDLLRAKKTAEIIALEHKLAVVTNKLLRERYYGHLDGKSAGTLKKTYKIYDTLSDKERYKYKITEEIESDEEIISRFITFIREVSLGFVGKNILIVSHAGIIRALLVHLGWATYRDFLTYRIGNTAYIKLLSDGIEFYIEETKGIKKPNE